MGDVLLDRAHAARENAYAPYSEYEVGAAVETDRGTFEGANVEVSGRTTSVHAEMMAMFTAVMNGAEEFHRLAISCDGDYGPCALCLHTISEFTHDLEIFIQHEGENRSFQLTDEYNNAYRPMNAEHHTHHG